MDSQRASQRARARAGTGRVGTARVLTIGVVTFLSLAMIVGGCGGGGDASGAAAAVPTRKGPAPVEQFTGSVDDFYRVPEPLRVGKRGALIRVQPIATVAGATTVRVMYHSRDVRHHDRAVTGVITYPTAPAPPGGWPVVSWAHGTTGLSSRCAPSRNGGPAPAFGVEGVRVATDYIGLGPIGERHPYLSGRSEAHSVIDAVRAARNLEAAHAGTRWLAIGHSQGGHSALFTNQLAQTYGRGLSLLGTATIAPAAMLKQTFGPADQIVPRMVGIMALYGLAADYPAIDPDDYVGAEVAARAHVIDEGCLDDIVGAMVVIPADTFYRVNPLEQKPAKAVIHANDPGRVRAEPPLLLVYGTADTFVVPARVDALFAQLCKVGQVTDLERIDGADHGTVPGQAAGVIGAWFADRLAGQPAPNSCRA